MPNLTRPTIAIIGGGPGGLPLARLLQMQGANVIVYERDTSQRPFRYLASDADRKSVV